MTLAARPNGHVSQALVRLAIATLPLAAVAQVPSPCAPFWLPGAPFPGPSERTLALLPLPNGDLIAGGEFEYADRSPVQYLARFDGSDWLPFDPSGGANDHVYCLARAANGDIYAGGDFTAIGGIAANHIARYDGTQWHALAAGLDGRVRTICVTSSGELAVGGDFLTGSSLQLNQIARWDGQAWADCSGGVGTGAYGVNHIAEHGNGDLIVGGEFQYANGLPAHGLARWNSNGWATCNTQLGTRTRGLATLPSGDVAAVTTSPNTLAIWDGSSLQQTNIGGSSTALAVDASGDLIVIGNLSPPGLFQQDVVRFDGSTWSAIGGGIDTNLTTVAVAANGEVIVAGRNGGNQPPSNVARFDDTDWVPLGADAWTKFHAFQRLPNGDLVVCGSFTTVQGVPANNIARYDGSSWHALGSGLDATGERLAIAGGELIVAGEFTSAGGQPANHIARWDGIGWSPLGAGLAESPQALAGGADGQVYANILPNTSRWDGTQWQAVPLSPGPGPTIVLDMTVLPDGRLVAASSPLGIGGQGQFRAWDGVQWAHLGSPGGQVGLIVTTMPNGDLVGVTAPGGVQRWNGNSWQALGGGTANAVGSLPNGDLVATGSFPTLDPGLARWTGAGWDPIATTVGGIVTRIGITGNGDIFLQGNITEVEETVANGLAQAIATCPATATAFATGCPGSGGPLTLGTEQRPWTGSSVELTSTGAPAGSLGVQVSSLVEATVPLPFGTSGCTLDVVPDLLQLMVPSAGEARATLLFPADPSFAGVIVSTQSVVFEFDSTGAVQQTASSNGLRLIVGTL